MNAYQQAEQKIAAALREGATELDLSRHWRADDSEKLTELPDSLGQLTQLQTLNLSSNKLSALPESLGQLTQLQTLNLSSNNLSALPELLGQLTQLQSLDLRNNQLSALPEWLGKLTRLYSLDISRNQLSTLPDSLRKLIQLQWFNLTQNKLTVIPNYLGNLHDLSELAFGANELISLPNTLGQLKKIKEIYIWSNSIDKLPKWIATLPLLEKIEANRCKITNLPSCLVQLEHLNELLLNDNPLNPELAAAYAQGLPAVKAYLRAKGEEQIILDEAKLILIGEGGVGKTSLLGALRGDIWVEDRKTTHGVEVDIKTLQLGDEASGKTITFNGWDFGGQNIYRHTHQLYFTAPAVYLVVWEPRRGPEQCAVAEWIKMVKQRADDETRPDERPRILVVATHGGPKERLDHIDEQALRDEFGDLIRGFLHVDSKTEGGLAELKKTIAREAAAIPSVGRSVPKSWKNMLEALRQRSQTEPYISYRAFEAVCAEQGLEPLLVTTYAAILNELGHIIHYHGDVDLRETVILKAEWLSKAISYVLEDRGTKARSGLVTHARLSEIWDAPIREDRYPAAVHPVFLKLMERFDFAYRVAMPKVEDPTTSLIAQLVPNSRPDDWVQDCPPTVPTANAPRCAASWTRKPAASPKWRACCTASSCACTVIRWANTTIATAATGKAV